eukprot:COSAG01_NODE_3116_length_6565_cov_2.533406_1_plen_31_part_10
MGGAGGAGSNGRACGADASHTTTSGTRARGR